MKIFRFIFLVIFIVGILSVNLPVHGENNAVNVDEYNKAVEAYRNVLQNIEQIKILFRKNYYMKRYYLRFYMNNVAYKYYTDYNDEYWNSYFEHFAVNKFTVLDMDSNNIPEVILDITPNNDIMVLYYYDSIVYCYTCIRTELYNLKKDGTFYWQNGWSVNGFDKFELINGIFERRTLAYFGSFSADIISYYISDKEVSDQEFGMFYYEQEQKENADWYDFNDIKKEKV